MTVPTESGFRHIPGCLNANEQAALLAEIRKVIAQAPFFTPRMPRSGRPFSVRMTNCGPLGWVSDKDAGYRYQSTHPETGALWPPIPRRLLRLWDEVSGYRSPPEACLVNYYGHGGRMGLHKDADEADMAAPVVSISLGDTAIFRLGGVRRRDPTVSLPLASGDVVVLAGASRGAYHGIDRVIEGSGDLLAEGGRINLTLRRVTVPGPSK